jgi:hypothetical protein
VHVFETIEDSSIRSTTATRFFLWQHESVLVGMLYHQYADDLQIYFSLCTGDFGDLSSMIQCTKEVSCWFLENALLLHLTKPEAVGIVTCQRLQSIDISNSVNEADAMILFADTVKLLSVTLDTTLSFDCHVTDVVRSCNRHIRAWLATGAANSVSSMSSDPNSTIASLWFGTTETTLNALSQFRICSRMLSSKHRGQLLQRNSCVRCTGCSSNVQSSTIRFSVLPSGAD